MPFSINSNSAAAPTKTPASLNPQDDDSLVDILVHFEALSKLVEQECSDSPESTHNSAFTDASTFGEIDADEVLEAFAESGLAESHFKASLPTSNADAVDALGFDLLVHSLGQTDQPSIKTSACPCCLEEFAVPRFGIAQMDFQIATCPSCNSGRMLPMPTPQQIANFYPSAYYGTTGAKFEPAVEMLVRLVGSRQASALSKGLPQGARVLDVGCGRGVLLGALVDRGFQAFGFEISASAAEGLDSRVDLHVADSLMEAKYPDHYFDQIVIWHVLEHVPNPREVMQEIHRILKPGGRVAVSVPNFTSLQAKFSGPHWFHLDSPRHLHHFSAEGLRKLIADCGFQPQSEHHFSLRQNPFGWLQSLLNKTGWFPRNALYSLLKNTDSDGTKSLSRRTRLALRTCYFLGMPVAIALSIVETIFRSGASISVTARAR